MSKTDKNSDTPKPETQRVTYNEGEAHITSTIGAEAHAKMVHEYRALKTASDTMRGDLKDTSKSGYAKAQFEANAGKQHLSPYIREINLSRARYVQVRDIKNNLNALKGRDR